MLLNKELEELFQRYTSEYTDFIGIELTDVNQNGMGDDRPLHLAARMGLLQDVDILLRNGAIVDANGDIGLTPIHYAAAGGHLDIVKRLLKAGANKSSKDEFGKTAVEWALSQGQVEIAEYLKRS